MDASLTSQIVTCRLISLQMYVGVSNNMPNDIENNEPFIS